MPRMRHQINRSFASDDDPLITVTQDLSAGQNNRQHPNVLAKNEAKVLTNADITLPGQVMRRPGLTLVEDLGTANGMGAFSYDPQGGTANVLVAEGGNVKRWIGSGSFTSTITGLTTNLLTGFTKAFKTSSGDVALVSNGTDNVREITSAYAVSDLGNTNTSPPLTPVMTFYRSRVWALKNDLLYYSSAAPSDYSAAFDRTTNAYRIPVGEERALVGTRDLGLLIVGKEQIWTLNPSATPAATDKPEKVADLGCAAAKTFVSTADDYFYLSFDGVRGLLRTEQDKLQYGTSLPLSYNLKTEFESINWASISKATAVYWQNKYFIALPTSGSSTNNQVWVYYPATKGWMIITGWNVGDWVKFKINGEERLYFIDGSGTGNFLRAWFGASDNGTAITFTIESRSDDLENPVVRKYGGDLEVDAKPTGDYNISVYGSFDNGAYSLLGTLNVGTGLITFSVTFPVTFAPDNIVREKFHLDSYGPWYQFRYKIEHATTTTNTEDITIYRTILLSLPNKYESE